MRWVAHTAYAVLAVGTVFAIHEEMYDPQNRQTLQPNDVVRIESSSNVGGIFTILSIAAGVALCELESGQRFEMRRTVRGEPSSHWSGGAIKADDWIVTAVH